jgi:hypothetical protein
MKAEYILGIWRQLTQSKTLQRCYSHSTAPGFITAEGESGECKPCICGAEREHMTLNSPLMVTTYEAT